MKILVTIIFFITIYVYPDIYIRNDNVALSKPIKSWIEFKNENLTRQNYDYSCGSASLSTIFTYYYGMNIGEKEILDDVLKAKGYDTEKKVKLEEGDTRLSFLDLANFSHSNNFKAIGLALDMDSLSKLKVPVILFVKIRKNEHFTIYKSMDINYVYLADPSFGNIKVKKLKFQEMFYQRDDLKYPGKILAIVPNTDFQKNNVLQGFMDIKPHSSFTYEVIRDKMKP